MALLKLGVFASGGGTNFSAILDSIECGNLHAEIKILISNNPDAGALKTAAQSGIKCIVTQRPAFNNSEEFADYLIGLLKAVDIDIIVLAGYMKKIPDKLIVHYKNRIVNIHPALLPAFGGKGMYGIHVHEAVIQSGCKVSGVTIHLVDEVYDHGPIIAQETVPVNEGDSPQTLAASVLKVEHQLYPKTLQLFAENRVRVENGKVVVLDKS